MLPLLGGILGGIGKAGLTTLGTAGQVLGTGLATVAQPIASGIGYVGQGIGSLAGYKPQGAEFVGPPEKFSLSPLMKSVGQAGLDATIASTISNATQPKQMMSPQILPMPNLDYGTSRFAPRNVGRFKPQINQSINEAMLRKYGNIYEV
tara:strand:+ start:681 stop:1127 length:447 start_codon:yes stop_codon:yes gene_type:complete